MGFGKCNEKLTTGRVDKGTFEISTSSNVEFVLIKVIVMISRFI